MTHLKLNALDRDDLDVLSAHLQDAVVKVGEMTYLEKDQRFVMVLNRFDWHDALAPGTTKKTHTRHRTGLEFARVLGVRHAQLNRTNQDAVIALLTIEFAQTEAPSGIITLVFAGGGALKLEVECIEARLSDLGATWQTHNLPDHEKN